MFPEKHFKDLESSERKSKIFKDLAIASLFFSSFTVLGPFIHEFAHLAMLELKNCNYIFDMGFKILNGVHAEARPLCAISQGYLLLFYSVGYLATLIVGVTLNIVGSVSKENSYLSAMGTGMLLSVLLTIGSEGDIQNALEILSLDQSYGFWISLLIILGVLAASFQGLENLAGLEREE